VALVREAVGTEGGLGGVLGLLRELSGRREGVLREGPAEERVSGEERGKGGKTHWTNGGACMLILLRLP
jgi:hypothetical protein